jgi:hypothetical protein
MAVSANRYFRTSHTYVRKFHATGFCSDTRWTAICTWSIAAVAGIPATWQHAPAIRVRLLVHLADRAAINRYEKEQQKVFGRKRKVDPRAHCGKHETALRTSSSMVSVTWLSDFNRYVITVSTIAERYGVFSFFRIVQCRRDRGCF